MRKVLHLIIFLLLGFGITQAQTVPDTSDFPYWIDMMQQPGQNFFQTQRAFNLYWQNRTPQKGDGFKVFKRWEFGIGPLVQPDGSIMDAGDVYNAIEQEYLIRSGQQMVTFGAPCLSNGRWTEIGPVYQPGNRTSQPNGLGRLNAIAFHPTDSNQIWVGAPAGGLWHTFDGGQTWITHTDTLATLGVSSIAIHPDHPDTIYIGTGDRDASDSYGLGVFVSYDAGRTWKQHNTGMGNRTVGRLIIDDNNPDVLIAATNNGMYRSTNGGANWTQRIGGNFKDVVFKPGNTSVAYATRDRYFYRSTDNGNSYTLISSGIPGSGNRGAIAVTPADTNFVYFVLCNQRTFNSLNLSTDGGSSFSTMSTTPNIMDYSHLGTGTGGQAWYDLDIAADPLDKSIVYVGGVNIFRSADSGTTWKINAHWVGTGAPAVHADHHVFEYHPLTDALYSGHDGGIHRTHNQGKNWIDLSKGLGIAQIYRLSQSAQSRDMLLNGYQDNGTGMMIDGQWFTVMGGDGMDCAINPSDNTWGYSDLYYGDVRRYKNGFGNGTIAKNGVNGINESGDWVTPFILQEGKPSTMFIGYKNIWRSHNVDTNLASQVKWTRISNNLAGSNSANVQHLENSMVDPERLYVSRHDNKLFRTDNVSDANPIWTNLTANLPVNAKVSWIESHPFKKDEVYITQNNRLYKSIDAGANFTDYSTGLPNIPIISIVCDSSSTRNGMYAGTFGGVYYRDTTMSAWMYYSDGLPLNSRVRDLEIYYDAQDRSKSHVVAATYGRGNWRSPLYDEEEIKPVAGAYTLSHSICVSEVLDLLDSSAKYPTEFQWIVEPAHVVFVDGTDSSSKDVRLRFTQKGTYTIKHIARNCYGEDTVTLLQKIEVPEAVTAAACAGSTKTIGNFNMGIHQVKLAGLSFASGTPINEGGYLNWACTKVFNLKSDTSYWAEISTGPSYDESVRIYIDFNDNGSFSDGGEQVFESRKKRIAHKDSIRIPLNPVFNKVLRMRVMSDYDTMLMPLSSCDSVRYGQIEDYGVVIQSPSAEPYFTVSRDTVCAGDWVLFTDSSSGIIGNYRWDFPEGASKDTFLTQGPHLVSFDSSGWQSVRLTLNGNSIYTRDSAVFVKALPKLSYTLNGKDTALCERLPLQIQVEATGNGIIHEWKHNGMSSMQNGTTLNFTGIGLADSGLWSFHASANGCADSLNSLNIEVYPHPFVQLSSDTAELCERNHQFKLKATTHLPPSSFHLNSLWSGGSSTDSVFNVQFATLGNQQIKTIASSVEGCKDSAEISVAVLPHPLASIKLKGSDAHCLDGNAFQLEDQSSFAQTYSLNWDLGDATQSTQSSFTHVYTAAGIYTVQMIAASAKGCSDTALQQLQVHPQPQADILLNQNPQCFALHSLDAASNSSISSGAIVQYNWELGDGSTAINNSFTGKTYTTHGTYTITLVATSDEGCVDTASTDVIIAPEPSVHFEVNDSIQCFAGHSFVFSNLSSINAGTLSYNWEFGDGSVSSAELPAAKQYSDTLRYTVLLEATSDLGCTGSHSKQVRVLSGPVADIPTGVICVNEPFSFGANISTGTQVLWELNNGMQSDLNPWEPIFDVAGAYTVTLYLTDPSGCSDTATLAGALVVHPRPNADFEAQRSGSEGLSTTFRIVNHTVGAQFFNWYFSNGSVSSSDAPEISFSDTGNYRMMLVATNDENCSDTAIQWVYASPEALDYGVNAFSPNADGLNDVFRIAGIEVARTFHLRIFNRWGETVFESTNPQHGWNGTYKGQEVPEGHYFYQLRAISLDGRSVNGQGMVRLMR